MNERKIAIQAMRKIVHRQRHTSFEDALNETDKTLLVKIGLCEWHTGTDIDGSSVPYLMLSEAGMIAHEFALAEKKWKRKWEIAKDTIRAMGDNYREILARYREARNG